MKKLVCILMASILIFSLAACTGNNEYDAERQQPETEPNADVQQKNDDKKKQKCQIDYADAASFEKALNDGEKVEGKIVQFNVIEYKPDSALGINCWSGEHLNFISENELDIKKGDTVVGRVTKEPTKALGSWKIPYEVLSINDKAQSTYTRSKKSGFNSKTNEVYQLAGYTVEIPQYWESENKIDGGFQRYAEKGAKALRDDDYE